MSDTVLAGVLGALLSKTGGAPAQSGRETELGADSEKAEGAATLFGELFNGAGATPVERPASTFETGLFLKRPPKAALAHALTADGAEEASTHGSFAPAIIKAADIASSENGALK